MSGTGIGMLEVGFGVLWFVYACGPLVLCALVALAGGVRYGVRLPVAAGMGLVFAMAAIGLTTILDRALITVSALSGMGSWYSYAEVPDGPFVFFGGPVILVELVLLFIGAPLTTWWWCYKNGSGRNLPPASRDIDIRRRTV